jgi:hypothetical protein
MFETWNKVHFNLNTAYETTIEVSNSGRVRKLNSKNEIVYLNGSLVSGYAALRLRAFKERDPKDQQKLDQFRVKIEEYNLQIKELKNLIKVNKKTQESYDDFEQKLQKLNTELEQIKKKYQKIYKSIETNRSVNFGGLIHRLVAELYVEKPSDAHDLVAHLNYNKLDNRAINLKWMTREENVLHQQKSPYVIQSKINNLLKKPHEKARNTKLTVSNVMIIKKRIHQGVTLTKLAKKFKVSEMQISRIKKGENWSEVPAAL